MKIFFIDVLIIFIFIVIKMVVLCNIVYLLLIYEKIMINYFFIYVRNKYIDKFIMKIYSVTKKIIFIWDYLYNCNDL
jgi:hypothetical protein